MAKLAHPLVSVITAFYNEEAYLSEAIESVLSQKYVNWELLLVDDGSNDQSTEIAKAYALLQPEKIFYIEHLDHANKGVSASRNEAIKRSKGELIAFLDADDTWLPDKLTFQVPVLLHHNVAMLLEASAYWFMANTGQERLHIMQVGAPQNKVYQHTELIQYLYPLGKGAAPCPSGILITKAAINKVGGFEESFTSEYQLYEDQAFLLKVYLNEKIYVSSACLNKYRQREGSCVQRVKSNGHYHKVRRYFLEWLRNYIMEKNIVDKSVHHYVKAALIQYKNPIQFFLLSTLPAKLNRMLKKKLNKVTIL